MDSRSQMDIQGSEDSTFLHLTHDLDAHIGNLRKDVLEAVGSIRSRIYQQAGDLIERERAGCRENERRLIAQIEGLQDLLGKRTAELERCAALNERLVAQRQRQCVRRRQRALCLEAVRRWHDLVASKKRRERICEHLVAVRRDKELRTAFFNWRLDSQANKFKEWKEKAEGDHRRALTRMSNENHTSENKMKLELLAMREQLQKEEERRAILEERLKAAFMRGVCALNMEAMQVLRNSGGEADISVASLLQGLNLSSGIEGSTCVSNEPGTTERMLRQQQEVQEQLNALSLHDEPSQHFPATAPPPPMPMPRPAVTAAMGARPSSAASGVSHSAGRSAAPLATVTINPSYPVRHGTAGGQLPTGAAAGRRVGSAHSTTAGAKHAR